MLSLQNQTSAAPRKSMSKLLSHLLSDKVTIPVRQYRSLRLSFRNHSIVFANSSILRCLDSIAIGDLLIGLELGRGYRQAVDSEVLADARNN